MSGSRCCRDVTGADGAPDPASAGPRFRQLGRRCLGLAAWACPDAVLAFMPKCPLCLAGYVAVGTGIGLSAPAAGHARTALIVACTASLVFLAATRSPLRRLLRRGVPWGALHGHAAS